MKVLPKNRFGVACIVLCVLLAYPAMLTGKWLSNHVWESFVASFSLDQPPK